MEIRTNATSTHRRLVGEVGEHEPYVEISPRNLHYTRDWLIGAVVWYLSDHPGITKLSGQKLYQIADKYCTAYGRTGHGYLASSADAAALVDATSHESRLKDGGIKLGQSRFWLTRKWFVNAIAGHRKAGGKRPNSVGALEKITHGRDGIAVRDGTVRHNHAPDLTNPIVLKADEAIAELLPGFGETFPRTTSAIMSNAPSISTVAIVAGLTEPDAPHDLFAPTDSPGGGLKVPTPEVDVETPKAADIEDVTLPERALVQVYRILRDTKEVRRLKRLYGHCCQICSTTIKLSDGNLYAEGHHIRPLGGTHKGEDNQGNILVLCPNCHVKCDYGCIEIHVEKLRVLDGHKLDSKNIEYHNAQRFERF